MSKAKVVTFGEVMLRLSPPGYERFEQAHSLNMLPGGSEANVAVSLARFGHDSSFVSRLPAHELGDWVLSRLQAQGVRTRHVLRGGQRVGIYYCEKGAAQRPSKVIYDRTNSSVATLAPGDLDWKAVLAGADWLHLSGITPALSPSCLKTTRDAVAAAKKAGIRVSLDLNYRKNLWSREEAQKALEPLAASCHLIIANEEDAANVFDIRAKGSKVESGKVSAQGYREVAREIRKRFKPAYVAITLRRSHSASHNGWSGLLYDGSKFYEGTSYEISVIDRIGAGDAFAAGLIHGLIRSWKGQQIVDFAVAASCLKHSIEGDFNAVSEAEVLQLLKTGGSGRVLR